MLVPIDPQTLDRSRGFDWSDTSEEQFFSLISAVQMRIVFLAVDDEFAGAMQRYVYKTHPEWVVGSIISKNAIYKKNALQAMIFIIRKCGFMFFLEMFKIRSCHPNSQNSVKLEFSSRKTSTTNSHFNNSSS